MMKQLPIIKWSSPSNIALVKYWGKFGDQFPRNPSISFTLKHAFTVMELELTKKDTPGISLDFIFEGSHNTKFQEKIFNFLQKEKKRFPWIESFHLKLTSSNTFPHSSGIASSASSMSALALCLLSADEYLNDVKRSPDDFFREASEVARLASGSASRSLFPVLASWGEEPSLPGSSNHFASPFTECHPDFKHFCDSILIVSSKEKSVSSRAGHSLMENHPYKDARYLQAHRHMKDLVNVLKTGDLDRFIQIVEEEALSLHALMMTSNPSYILLRPESLVVIDKIREFRSQTKIPACFTIDAGPNIHLLYRACDALVVKRWIEEELSLLLPELKWIHDEVGDGPVRLS